MKKFISKFVANESGATAIEYGLIAALLAVGISAALTSLKTQLNSTFASVTTKLQDASR